MCAGGQPQTTWDEKIQQFLTTFVESESEFDCELPGLLIQQMESLLPLGHGKECLVQAQEHVLKSLRLQWSKYAARDLECFWTNVNSTSRSATHKLLARRSPLRRTTSKSPLADSTRPAIISGLSASSYRCWRSLVLVRPQWDRGLCELHGVSGVTSCGSVTSLGSRRGPVMLTTDQLEHVRLRLEEERLRKLRESRIIRVKKITEEVVEAKPSVQLDAGVAINQLTRPKKFHQVLLNLDYREHFRCFLTMQEAEIPLQFWVAVYEMKRQCRTHTEAQETARQIKRRFFSKAMRKGAALQCKEKLITDIGAAEDVSPADLFTAASLVAQSLKKQWFSYYRNTLPPAEGDDEEDEEVIDVKAVMIATRPQLTRQRKTRYLWTTCIKRICHFRRGLSSKITRRAFKRYLNLQKFMPDGQRKPEYAMRKIMKNSQLISISRLTYDLDFWVEVDKYKQMADEAGMPWGEQTREEEAFIQRKAFAVINCFLDSVVPPKIQVNVSTEVVNKIVDNAACGTIKRSIFHAASMQIFNVLAHYWKRFCCHRAGLEAEVEKRRPSQRPSILFRQQPRKTDGSQTSGSSNKSKKEQTAAGDDDVMCISFSITTGIQLERHRFSHITNEATAAQS
ncbi:regulator of G-protein signaling protein-like [Corticium candelabrum]|uniref:regulator of G-protein signaling protein-like n=1 Tax=Corticium candelabrum TaxID=121492 RepID=UPI002E26B25E|nr:regulator of G-protein signaling protein-like [Corticium candelabrum]